MSGANIKKEENINLQDELSKKREKYKESFQRYVQEKERRESEILENPSTKYKPQ